MTKRYDPRRVKRHFNYTAKELAYAFGVSIGTVRAWTKSGLHPIDRKRPFLFTGEEIQRFIAGHNKPRQPLAAGEIYCVACKTPIRPHDDQLDYVPLSETWGDFVGTCPRCHRRVHRRVRLAEVMPNSGGLKVRYQDVQTTIDGSGDTPRAGASGEDAS